MPEVPLGQTSRPVASDPTAGATAASDAVEAVAAASDATVASNPLSAMVAEYTALRREIEWLIKDSGQYQTYALGLIAVLPPAFALISSSHQPWLVVPAILAASAAFSLFGFLFFRGHQEVYVVASYIQSVIRPQVRRIAGSEYIWDWEEYKTDTSRKLQRASRLAGLANPRLILILRLMVFLLPAFIGVVGVSIILISKGLAWSLQKYTWPGLVFVFLFLVIDLAVIVIFSLWFWISSDLSGLLEHAAQKSADSSAST